MSQELTNLLSVGEIIEALGGRNENNRYKDDPWRRREAAIGQGRCGSWASFVLVEAGKTHLAQILCTCLSDYVRWLVLELLGGERIFKDHRGSEGDSCSSWILQIQILGMTASIALLVRNELFAMMPNA